MRLKAKMQRVVSLHLECTRDRYSVILLGAEIARQEWLGEEYVSGRIDEKRFLESLLIQTSDRRPLATVRVAPRRACHPTSDNR